ncbi:MAG TPA: hypothetical protein VFQ51_01280, partial [Vicinamibacteria bacterium]|nr:hypothetical protein [Vicinamibacteria bacterium]
MATVPKIENHPGAAFPGYGSDLVPSHPPRRPRPHSDDRVGAQLDSCSENESNRKSHGSAAEEGEAIGVRSISTQGESKPARCDEQRSYRGESNDTWIPEHDRAAIHCGLLRA